MNNVTLKNDNSSDIVLIQEVRTQDQIRCKFIDRPWEKLKLTQQYKKHLSLVPHLRSTVCVLCGYRPYIRGSHCLMRSCSRAKRAERREESQRTFLPPATSICARSHYLDPKLEPGSLTGVCSQRPTHAPAVRSDRPPYAAQQK